jgi:putative transposase
MPLLTNDTWREMLSRAIDRAAERHRWRLAAFVYMPEHVHLLWYPEADASGIEHLLKAIKRPYSYRIKQLLVQQRSRLLDRLTTSFRKRCECDGFVESFSRHKINSPIGTAGQASSGTQHTARLGTTLTRRSAQWHPAHGSSGHNIN